MSEWGIVVLAGLMTIVGSTLAWYLARRDKREERRHNDQSPTPPTTQQVWERLDRLERRTLPAVVGVLREVVEQLPDGFQATLTKRHVAVLTEEGLLPDGLQYQERG